MSKHREWTIEEANAQIRGLSLLVARQLARGVEIERCMKRLRAEIGAAPGGLSDLLLQVGPNASDQARALANELNERLREYEQGWHNVETLGVTVKDPRIGLCDFYGRVDDKAVWLCWRYGEEAIEFYHDLDAGFAGRKPLTAAKKQRLLN